MINNDKGFNLTQTMVGVALSAGVLLGVMKMMSNSQKDIKNFERKFEMDMFLDSIAKNLASKTVCDLNFRGRYLNQPVSKIISSIDKNGKEVPVVEVGKEYLQNSVKIENIHLSAPKKQDANDTKQNSALVNLTITFKHLRKTGYNIVRKDIVLSTLNDGSKILGCYYSLGDLSTSDLTDLAKKICKGPGVHVNLNEGRCYFKSFPQSGFATHNQNSDYCEKGYTLRNVTYDISTYTYTGVCEPGLDTGPECKIKNIGSDGKFKCLAVEDLVDSTPDTVVQGANCSLVYVDGNSKMRFNCI